MKSEYDNDDDDDVDGDFHDDIDFIQFVCAAWAEITSCSSAGCVWARCASCWAARRSFVGVAAAFVLAAVAVPTI